MRGEYLAREREVKHERRSRQVALSVALSPSLKRRNQFGGGVGAFSQNKVALSVTLSVAFSSSLELSHEKRSLYRSLCRSLCRIH
jgi:hypothetical protein